MSRGIGAHANLVLEDENTVIYEYGGYNLNEPEYRNEKHLQRTFGGIARNCRGNAAGCCSFMQFSA